MKSLWKIVITGGPCGGKTTALAWLQKHFPRRSYQFLCIPESATSLINAGITPDACGLLNYERCEIALQIAKEKLFEFAATSMSAKETVIVCDRGVFDNLAWLNNGDFDLILTENLVNRKAVFSSYDAVFHLVTAANGAEEYYSLDNNLARSETPEEARILDKEIVQAWSGHPHHIIIDNSTGFKEKMDRLVVALEDLLGCDDIDDC